MKTFLKLFFTTVLFFLSCNNIDQENISGINFIPIDSHTILNINDLEATKNIFKLNPLMSSIYTNTDIISSKLNDLTSKESNLVNVKKRNLSQATS